MLKVAFAGKSLRSICRKQKLQPVWRPNSSLGVVVLHKIVFNN